MPSISTKLTLATRLERTVAHRAALYEEIAYRVRENPAENTTGAVPHV